MLSVTQSVIAVAVSIALAMGFLLLLRSKWDIATRQAHNAVVGSHVGRETADVPFAPLAADG